MSFCIASFRNRLSYLAGFYVQSDNLRRAFALRFFEGVYNARVQHPQDILGIQIDVHDVLQRGACPFFLERPAREGNEIGLAILIFQGDFG